MECGAQLPPRPAPCFMVTVSSQFPQHTWLLAPQNLCTKSLVRLKPLLPNSAGTASFLHESLCKAASLLNNQSATSHTPYAPSACWCPPYHPIPFSYFRHICKPRKVWFLREILNHKYLCSCFFCLQSCDHLSSRGSEMIL